MRGFEGGSTPLLPPAFLRLVDGRKHPWWIVDSLPHQKKPRLLVFHPMCHTLRIIFLCSDSRKNCQAYLHLVSDTPCHAPRDSWILLMRSKAGATRAHLPCEVGPPWSGRRVRGDIGKWAMCSMPGNGCFQQNEYWGQKGYLITSGVKGHLLPLGRDLIYVNQY